MGAYILTCHQKGKSRDLPKASALIHGWWSALAAVGRSQAGLAARKGSRGRGVRRAQAALAATQGSKQGFLADICMVSIYI